MKYKTLLSVTLMVIFLVITEENKPRGYLNDRKGTKTIPSFR